MSKKRATHSASFKAKVALAAVKQEKTISELASIHNVHPTVISKWKAQLLENAATIFVDGRSKKISSDNEQETKNLYEKIGRLEVENDFLKKKVAQFD